MSVRVTRLGAGEAGLGAPHLTRFGIRPVFNRQVKYRPAMVRSRQAAVGLGAPLLLLSGLRGVGACDSCQPRLPAAHSFGGLGLLAATTVSKAAADFRSEVCGTGLGPAILRDAAELIVSLLQDAIPPGVDLAAEAFLQAAEDVLSELNAVCSKGKLYRPPTAMVQTIAAPGFYEVWDAFNGLRTSLPHQVGTACDFIAFLGTLSGDARFAVRTYEGVPFNTIAAQLGFGVPKAAATAGKTSTTTKVVIGAGIIGAVLLLAKVAL